MCFLQQGWQTGIDAAIGLQKDVQTLAIGIRYLAFWGGLKVTQVDESAFQIWKALDHGLPIDVVEDHDPVALAQQWLKSMFRGVRAEIDPVLARSLLGHERRWARVARQHAGRVNVDVQFGVRDQLASLLLRIGAAANIALTQEQQPRAALFR